MDIAICFNDLAVNKGNRLYACSDLATQSGGTAVLVSELEQSRCAASSGASRLCFPIPNAVSNNLQCNCS